jgi:tetratricopeptide (TPR) repeat protein
MTRKRIGLIAALVVLLALGGALGGVLSDSSSSGRATEAAPPDGHVADQALAGFSIGDTEGLVLQLQNAVRENPRDAKSLALLGLAYQQRARETGDPSYYTKSDGILREALQIAPGDLLATSGLGSLALARHQFRNALELGEKAKEISPTTARNYGVIGDALIELGRYQQAFEMFDHMSRLKPGLPSYSRVSYARELLGDHDGAISAMKLALDATRGAKEPYAWTLVQLGKLYWAVGQIDQAETVYRQALQVFPSYVYALDALGQVEFARGDTAAAIELTKQAVDQIPLPQFVTQLGDLYASAGQTKLAQQQYDLMDAIRRLFVANGSKVDLETSIYYADHGIRLPQALELARTALADRPGIYGDDALAWALERNGRCEEALTYSKRALRLGTLDANLYFHRGMIEQCLGHDGAAGTWFLKALDLNPHFSIVWASVAQEAVS